MDRRNVALKVRCHNRGTDCDVIDIEGMPNDPLRALTPISTGRFDSAVDGSLTAEAHEGGLSLQK